MFGGVIPQVAVGIDVVHVIWILTRAILHTCHQGERLPVEAGQLTPFPKSTHGSKDRSLTRAARFRVTTVGWHASRSNVRIAREGFAESAEAAQVVGGEGKKKFEIL